MKNNHCSVNSKKGMNFSLFLILKRGVNNFSKKYRSLEVWK
ncbi:hypothetical protein CAPGI0001_0412 [Capnocytophaga gingivalis ATCC 33624]|nr:hypothetical protein CAPGI0001_0412 [Capnocytophaga gingivalis ATCC 33624]